MKLLRYASRLAFVLAATSWSGCLAHHDDEFSEFQEALPEQSSVTLDGPGGRTDMSAQSATFGPQATGNATFSLALRPDEDTRMADASSLGETTNAIIERYGLPVPEAFPPGNGPIPTPVPTAPPSAAPTVAPDGAAAPPAAAGPSSSPAASTAP